MYNFQITNPGQSIDATTTSAAIPLVGRCGNQAMIYNPGPNIVFVRVGYAEIVATPLCMPILAGEKGAYAIGLATHIAVLGSKGPQTIMVFTGQGS